MWKKVARGGSPERRNSGTGGGWDGGREEPVGEAARGEGQGWRLRVKETRVRVRRWRVVYIEELGRDLDGWIKIQ